MIFPICLSKEKGELEVNWMKFRAQLLYFNRKIKQ